MEHVQYPAIETYLRKQWNCSRTWRVGKTPRIALKVPDPHQRVPDVVGARQSDDQWQTVIVEAKRKDAGGHAIQQAIAQLEAVSDWAHYLFLSLETADWRARKLQDQVALESEVKRRGVGLLLVDGMKVEQRVDPTQNSGVHEAARDELLGWLGIECDTAPRAIPEPLSASQARVARLAFALVDQFLWDAVPVWQDIFKKSPGQDPKAQVHTEYRHRPPTAILSTSMRHQGVELEGDPFGCYRDDGVPVLWLWTRAPIKRVDARLRISCRGWFYFAHNDLQEHRVTAVGDVDLTDLAREGFTRAPQIGWPILIAGRTKSSVQRELVDLINVVRQKRFKSRISSAA
jgi:hypothetical protein